MFIPNGLSADQAPPFSAPVRFFVTAPIFAVIAGMLLLFIDINYFVRGTPQTIAFIHLLTLGFAGFIMIGALQQMLPVLAGVNFPKPKLLANFLYISLVIGIYLFVFGFLSSQQTLFLLSIFFLATPVFIFAIVVFWILSKVTFINETVNAMKFSILALVVVAFSGTVLLYSHSTMTMGDLYLYAKLIHINFASFGWILLLIFGVSFQVIPMFWGSSEYSPKQKKYLIYLIFGMLVFLILVPTTLFTLILSLIVLAFSIFSLRKLSFRKRKVFDIAVLCWQISLSFLSMASILIMVNILFEITLNQYIFIFFGIGFVMTLLYGMLYKIVPFLSWFHLSGQGIWDIPTIKEMIQKRYMQAQIVLHILSIIFFLFGVIKFGAIFFIASNTLFLKNISKPVLLYYSKIKKS